MGNIKAALDKKEKPYWIPGVSREELPAFFKELGFKNGVEVGVKWGENIANYCKEGRDHRWT